ncbi:MAG: hypothetical protein ACD_62C00431G0006 [uncultured bacterium]|nr:MAG: hypothetical protein ACD_62C00431G0006 [uncultured bacterium]
MRFSLNAIRTVKNKIGFTLVEVILTLIVTGSLFAIVAGIMQQQVQTFAFISDRKATMGDVRRTLNDMNYELLHITHENIQAISSTSINFVDSAGQNSSYTMGLNGQDLSVFRGNDDVILPGIQSFFIEYQDGMGNELEPLDENIPSIVRIKLTITTEPKNDEESMTISTTVIPRDFVGYSNYQ